MAVSLLQKAIRRGEDDLAHQAAVTLLVVAPDRFWRRCSVIAAEEIGVANAEAVALITIAATAGKSWRAKLGGEIKVGQFITSMMAKSDNRNNSDSVLGAHDGLRCSGLRFDLTRG